MSVRRPSVRLLAIAAAAVAVVAAVLVVRIETTIRARWSAMEMRVAELRQEIEGLTPTRPALRGTAIQGNAWTEYAAAANAESREDITGLNEILEGPNTDLRDADDLIRKYSPGAVHLRKGACCCEVRLPELNLIDLNQSVNYPDLTFGILKLRARVLRRMGSTLAAAEILLDIAQVGLDIGRDRDGAGERAALEVQVFAYPELRDLLLSDRGTPEEFAEIGRQLELLDRAWIRHGPTYLNRSLAMGIKFLDNDLPHYALTGSLENPPLRDWRHLYSRRLMLVDAFEAWNRWHRRLSGCDALRQAEFEGLLQEVRAEAAGTSNALLRAILAQPEGFFDGALLDFNRERRAQLRLLRAVAHYRASGEVLALEDPFGGILRSRREGGTLRLWSVGADGKDDGGVGGWEPRPDGRKLEHVPDIVVEIRR